MAKNREFSLIAAYDGLKKHIPNLRQKKRGCKPLDRLIKIYFFTAPFFQKKTDFFNPFFNNFLRELRNSFEDDRKQGMFQEL